jgi:hypothetical protein
MEHLRLTATSLTRGRLEVTGRYSPAGGQFDVNGKDIALQPFNPYATHYSPYSIAAGALSVTTKATLGRGTYDSTTALTLDGFDLGSKEGASLFKEQFGISIEVALALLRDIQGRIAFDIPVEGDEQGAKVSVMTVAGQALRRALENAIASPLKLVGRPLAAGVKGAARRRRSPSPSDAPNRPRPERRPWKRSPACWRAARASASRSRGRRLRPTHAGSTSRCCTRSCPSPKACSARSAT